MFAFVVSYLFSADGRHSSGVTNIPRFIERMEDIHTKVQGMISPPHLEMTLLYDVLRRCNQYLNRYVAASDSKVVEALGDRTPFSLKPILVELEGGRYI